MWFYLIIAILFGSTYDWLRRYFWVSGLHKKCVFITGCDTGFGNALAKSLYSRGVFVIAGCYTEKGSQALNQETGDRLKTVLVDVSKKDSIKTAVQYVRDNIPKGTELWGIVNNAGIPGPTVVPIEFLSSEDFRQVMEINLFGMVEVTNMFLPMLKKSHGRVVNMASIAGEVAAPGMAPYAASKHAARGYSESLRLEKEIWGIKVSVIEPSFFKTNIVDIEPAKRLLYQKYNAASSALRDEYGDEFIEANMKLTEEAIDKMAEPNLNLVVKAYEHALFSRHPRATYYPGTSAKVMAALSVMPHVVLDTIYRRMSKPIPKALQNKDTL